jgi:hypothetical protein
LMRMNSGGGNIEKIQFSSNGDIPPATRIVDNCLFFPYIFIPERSLFFNHFSACT